MDRGLSFRTTLWLAGSAFVLSACWCFAVYLRFDLPWWTLAVGMGGLVGLVVFFLEWLIASPLEALVRASDKWAAGTLAGKTPTESFAARELRQLWRSGRTMLEQQAQAAHARRASEARARLAEARSRMLSLAVAALGEESALEDVVPELLQALAASLDVPAVYLVPLRSGVPGPALGPEGPSPEAEAIRRTGLAPWQEILAQGGEPVSLCLTEHAPEWREAWKGRTLWSVPLVYRGVPQGLLLARPEGADRTWTPDELALLMPLATLLSANLAAQTVQTVAPPQAGRAEGSGKRGRKGGAARGRR